MKYLVLCLYSQISLRNIELQSFKVNLDEFSDHSVVFCSQLRTAKCSLRL